MKAENFLAIIDSLVWPQVLLDVQSTSRRPIHLQYNISANALEIRAIQNPKCKV
jgi:hypothetical protein